MRVGWVCAERTIEVAGSSIPFGVDLLFQSRGSAPFTTHIEICEDVWVPQPPSTAAALAGAEVLLNLSASNITIGKADARRLFCASQSARCIAAYAYSAAGPGKSTTDFAWDGHAAVFKYGAQTCGNRALFAPFNYGGSRCRSGAFAPRAYASRDL